ncbi:hypothetical protein OG389_22185 [Streptomyces sp. NBC_00435]|uniref:hypothetical protein n=1 Tax=Streptomyces sp. NBC_00435 TaxID=2903649 RepID=UPI002E1DD29C
MNRKQLWLMTCGVTAMAALLSACGGGDGPDGGDGGGGGAVVGDAAPSAGASADPSPFADPVSEKAATAEKVKSAVEARLSVHEARFGSGGTSPCSTGSAKMFTQDCDAAVRTTNDDAAFALTQIGGHEGFATLSAAAQKIQQAAARYQELGCAKNPADAADRQACLAPASVLAQGFPDLRSGANLGLAGK